MRLVDALKAAAPDDLAVFVGKAVRCACVVSVDVLDKNVSLGSCQMSGDAVTFFADIKVVARSCFT